MDYRSSNVVGYTHFGGDIVSGVNDGRGVQIGTASTAATPAISPAGDDANVSIAILPKGTGSVYVGSTGTNAVGSKGFFSVASTWSNAAISSGQIAELTFASTTFDVDRGDIVSVYFNELAAPVVMGAFRVSTVNSSRLTVQLTVPGSTASSTLSGTVRVSWVDLT